MIDESFIYRIILDAAKQRSRIYYDKATIHVSEVVSCLRKAYYSRTRQMLIEPANALKVLGNGIHDAIQEILSRYGYDIEYEVKLRANDISLVGHIDAYSHSSRRIIEIKTSSRIPEVPYPNHMKQVQIYIELSKAREAYIVYISRTDGRVRIFNVERNKKILRWAIERARILSSSLKSDRAPERERSVLCSYCSFRDVCLKGSRRW